MINRQQAIDRFNSNDLVGLGMEADAVRKRLHPEGVVSYIIDRNINYTNVCTEYCSFCAFYRPPGSKEGYLLPTELILDKIGETIALGGTGILMQGGLHPDLEDRVVRSFAPHNQEPLRYLVPLFLSTGNLEHCGSQRTESARYDCTIAGCGTGLDSGRWRGDSG